MSDETPIDLQMLLGELTKRQFVEEYFHRLPFCLSEAGKPVCNFGTWEVMGDILVQNDVDVMVVRDGERYTGPSPSSMDQARELSEEGYTVLVRRAEKHHAGLADLAKSFSSDFAAAVNIHVYATPPGKYGFSWHYDAEDVFIMQTTGVKEYSLRKNTVNPWPLVETIPHDMRYERELTPLMRVLLKAGDWLYIPNGYWHRADARESEETAISLALGVMSPSAVDIFDYLRPQLLESLCWRQRLPVLGAARSVESREELVESYRPVFDQLADDLVKTLRDERFIADFLLSSFSDNAEALDNVDKYEE